MPWNVGEHRKYLAETHNAAVWFGKSRYAKAPVKNFAVETLHLQGWKLHRLRREENPPCVELILRRFDDVLEQLMTIAVWECADVTAAHEQLLASLMQVESTAIERDRFTEIGDVLFRLNDTFFVFARANLVVLVRNIGTHVLGIEELANTIDLAILRRLALGAPKPAPAPTANADLTEQAPASENAPAQNESPTDGTMSADLVGEAPTTTSPAPHAESVG